MQFQASAEKTRRILFAVLLFALYFTAPVNNTENHGSRYNLTRAIVLEHTFRTDSFHSARFSDWSSHGGHYYSNKAPGASFLAVPPYWLLSTLQRWNGIDPREKYFLNLVVIDAFVTKLLSVLLAMLFLLYLGARGVEERWSWVLVLGYCVGTIAYPFSTMFWGHQTAAFFLFLAFYLVFVQWRPVYSGAALGIAVLTDYAVILIAPAFLLAVCAMPELRRKLAWFLAGLAPPAALYAWYHWICFGSPFTTAMAFSNPEFGANQSTEFAMLSLPSPGILLELLFGTQRGLFLISPSLLLAFAGLVLGWRSRWRAETAVALWGFTTVLLLNASFNGWHGGWSSGPRYLVVALPLLATGWIYIPWKKTLVALMLVSGVAACLIATVNPIAIPGRNLFLEQIYPYLSDDAVPRNLLLAFLIISGLVLAVFRGFRKEEPSV